MPSLIAQHPRLALAVAATLVGLVLFGLGSAIAPGASGDASPAPPDVPTASVRPVDASKPLSVGTVRALGTLPALKAPKRKPRLSRGPSGGNPAVRPPVTAPPAVAPPPIAPPPVAPPPVLQTCIGAGCDYR